MDHQPGTTHEPVPLDPENDIDAKSATRWFIGSAVALFGCLWLLVPIFVRVQEFEHNRKVGLAPTTERNDAQDAENEFLDGANPSKKNIADVLTSLRLR